MRPSPWLVAGRVVDLMDVSPITIAHGESGGQPIKMVSCFGNHFPSVPKQLDSGIMKSFWLHEGGERLKMPVFQLVIRHCNQ